MMTPLTGVFLLAALGCAIRVATCVAAAMDAGEAEDAVSEARLEDAAVRYAVGVAVMGAFAVATVIGP